MSDKKKTKSFNPAEIEISIGGRVVQPASAADCSFTVNPPNWFEGNKFAEDMAKIQRNYYQQFRDGAIDDLVDSLKYSLINSTEIKPTEGGADVSTETSGLEKQRKALQEAERKKEMENILRITRGVRFPELTIPGFMLPDFNALKRGEAPPNIEIQVTVGPDGSMTVIEDPSKKAENDAKKKKVQERNEAVAREAQAAKEASSYKPGMPIAEFVEKQIAFEKDEERLKWLRTFQNCVLPEEVRDTIEEALTTVLMAKRFDEWGVNESFEKGLTNSILLYGPPGTGKTMIAESFAAVLGKNLLMVSNADIQSQVPGEAERNITKNFELAEKKDAVLMFDECDSLLYDRNSVGMIMASEINHLLTCIERFDGVVILTTNRLSRLDPALQRRIIAKVELNLPNEEARNQIWRNLVPKKVPVAGDVDYSLLAKLELSGGEIKNVILTVE